MDCNDLYYSIACNMNRMKSIYCFWISTMTFTLLNLDCFDDYCGCMHLNALRLLLYMCSACDNIWLLLIAKNTKEVLQKFLVG